MTNPEDDRKTKVFKHAEALDSLSKNIRDSKRVVQEGINRYKGIYDTLDKTETFVNKERDFVWGLASLPLEDIPDCTWASYATTIYTTDNVCASGEAFYHDLTKAQENESQLTTAVNSFYTEASGVSNITMVAFKQYPATAQLVQKLENTSTINDDAGYIISEVGLLDPDTAKACVKIFRDWKTADPDIGYTSLLELRSLIFYQLFDRLCPEAEYAKAPWFNRGTKKKRFCQAKFFMIGARDDHLLIRSLQFQVDSISRDMLDQFDKLSDYGKHGVDKTRTDALFASVMSTFVRCLSIRKSYHKP